MTTYYIFRHGETFATKAGTGYGLRIFTAGILPEAKPPLERMARFLKNKKTDFNVSSQLKRCRQTTQIISAVANMQFAHDRRLNEYFLETYGNLQRRVKSLINEIEEKDYKSVCICTHGAVIAAILHVMTKDKLKEEFNIYDFPPPGILTILKNNFTEQINFNEK